MGPIGLIGLMGLIRFISPMSPISPIGPISPIHSIMQSASQTMMRRRIHIGCSGWNYKHWRGRFYPEEAPPKQWFEFYAEGFDTVEINNTFYQLPAAQTFKAWREQAPDGFIYAVKANRYLTHLKRLKDAKAPL